MFRSEEMIRSRIRGPERAKSRKLRRFAVIAFCFLGFLYQTGSFMAMYFKYPTVTDVQVKMPDKIPLPAITYCDINLIIVPTYCGPDFNNACHLVNIKKFSKRYPAGKKIIGTFGSMYVPYSNITKLYNFPQAELLKYANFKFKLINGTATATTVYIDDDMDRTVKATQMRLAPSVRGTLKSPPLCLSFNVFRNASSEEWVQIPAGYTITTMMSMSPHTYVFGPQYGAFQISVHTPYNHNNPFVNGLEAKEGMSYFFDFSMVIKKSLPKPYETDCFDYLGRLREEGGTGPTNQKECVEECKMSLSRSELKCVLTSIWYPHSFRRCEPANERKLLATYTSRCEGRCKQACMEYIMETKKHEFVAAEKIACDSSMQILKTTFPSQSFFVARFSPAIETIYETLPKYQLTEIFSNIGGFIGMWMGVSLIALYNMFEGALALLWKALAARYFGALSRTVPY